MGGTTLIISFLAIFTNCNAALIKTHYATFNGYTDSAYGTDVFVGIPYAQPPTGVHRFQPPIPINQSQGVLDVSGPTSNQCFQLSVTTLNSSAVYSEDCLSLDIVRPVHSDSLGLPVYVFIHGYITSSIIVCPPC